MVKNNYTVKEVKELIKELEDNKRNKENINIDDIKSIEDIINDMNGLDNSVEYLLRHKLLNLKRYAMGINSGKLTRWDLFVKDILNLESEELKDLQDLVKCIDKNKDNTITNEELNDIQNKFNEVLYIIHKTFNQYERDRALNEIEKKIRLFKNRLSRVIEDDFGSWIRQLRKEKGYSLKELEIISGVTASYIHRLETGSRKTPSVPIAEKLAKGLGVDQAEFFKRLNIGNSENIEREPVSLSQTLAITPFLLNGEKATTSQKNAVINLINAILESKWSNETKVAESINIMNLIDNLKAEIPYKKDAQN